MMCSKIKSRAGRRTGRRWRLLAGLFGGLSLAWAGTCLYLSWRDPEVAFSPDEVAEVARLPAGFLMGTATAAHQVEGGNTRNDWYRFELEPGHIARGERSGLADDHWHRLPEDIALMRAIGTNAYRFSIEWSRLEPAEGRWDEVAWSHYKDELARLRAAGIFPMVTLLHFTLPAWLADRGGVAAPDFPRLFGRYAHEAASRLGEHVELWCTVNEPNVQMVAGYLDGVWPPGKRSPTEAGRAFAGLLKAHAAAAGALHAASSRARVGMAINLVDLVPASRASLLDWVAADGAGRAYNWSFPDAVRSGRIRWSLPGLPRQDEPVEGLAGSVDFFGLNYYTRYGIRFSPGSPGWIQRQPGPGVRTDVDWEIHPEGLLKMLRHVHQRYALPIYVTENGIADAAGTRRAAFIQAHLHAITRALQEGIPVQGYFHWSLLDNFEWAEGFRPRFGLYRVDYRTLERTRAPGSEVFEAWAKAPRQDQAPPGPGTRP